MPIEVKVGRNNYNQVKEVDKALRNLKRIMTSEGVMKEIKDRRHFLKPSEKRRKKAAEARSRRARDERGNDKGIM